MKHFYFVESETGEEFLVGADSFPEAEMIAKRIAADIAHHYGMRSDLVYEGEMTEDEAEASGLDEY